MNNDVRQLLKRFDTKHRPKIGDLVITAEIHRVVGKSYCRHAGFERDLVVITLGPECAECRKFNKSKRGRKLGKKECHHEHIMDWGRMGQQCVMILKGQP